MKVFLNDFDVLDFEFEGREVKLICPIKPNGKLAFKMEYWEAYPDVEASLIERGYHLVFVKNQGSRFLSKPDFDTKARLIKFLSDKYNLDGKCVPIGMSLGGAQGILFASYYPELISCMFLDAPVVDYSSMRTYMSNGRVWENEILKTFPGLKHYNLPGLAENPVNRVDALAENKIPMILSYGTEDATVSYFSNGALLEEVYEGTNLLKVIPVQFRGHHPHGKLDDNTEIVEFIVANS